MSGCVGKVLPTCVGMNSIGVGREHLPAGIRATRGVGKVLPTYVGMNLIGVGREHLPAGIRATRGVGKVLLTYVGLRLRRQGVADLRGLAGVWV